MCFARNFFRIRFHLHICFIGFGLWDRLGLANLQQIVWFIDNFYEFCRYSANNRIYVLFYIYLFSCSASLLCRCDSSLRLPLWSKIFISVIINHMGIAIRIDANRRISKKSNRLGTNCGKANDKRRIKKHKLYQINRRTEPNRTERTMNVTIETTKRHTHLLIVKKKNYIRRQSNRLGLWWIHGSFGIKKFHWDESMSRARVCVVSSLYMCFWYIHWIHQVQ